MNISVRSIITQKYPSYLHLIYATYYIKTCVPREEILAGELSLDLFAAKLRLVVEGKAPHVYQDATTFLPIPLEESHYTSEPQIRTKNEKFALYWYIDTIKPLESLIS